MIEYEETHCRVAGCLANNSYLRSPVGIRAALDAVVNKALEIGLSEGEIEKLFVEAMA